ncbi:MAG: class I SAM-dependent methyltransferase [Chloroflexota bacterium]|nr:class I SAM-dependent methyltransferase [Chloroflexota bacterium]
MTGDAVPAHAGWGEEDSARFIDMGEVLTPARDEMGRALLDHVPARPDETFTAVEIGCGAGWLSEALLERFGRARVVALDGSPAMLRHAGERLAPFGDRVELRHGRLEERDWLDRLGGPVRCFLSSLTLHHLDGPGKQALFARLFSALEPGGALCVADLVEPGSDWARRHMADAWTEAVRQRSLDLTGGTRAYDFFIEHEWNTYDYPDSEVDMPSPLADQVRWLTDAGFVNIDVPLAVAGHTVIIAYRPAGAAS